MFHVQVSQLAVMDFRCVPDTSERGLEEPCEKAFDKKKKVRDKGEERERQRGKEKKTKDRAPVYILFERGNEER